MKEHIKPIISDKPYSVPIEMRPLWRISLIIICISVVSANKNYLSTKKINILVWMLIRQKKWDEYIDFFLERSNDIPLVSVDTATFRAFELSIAKGFVNIEGNKIYLTDTGKTLFSLIIDNDILNDEVIFLKEYGKKLTEKKVKALTGKVN